MTSETPNQDLLPLLQALGGPVEPDLLEALAGQAPAEAALAALEKAGAVRRDPADPTALEPLDPDAVDPAAADHWIARLEAQQLAAGNPEPRIDEAILALGPAAGRREPVFAAGDRLATFQFNRGDLEAARATCERALALGEDLALRHALGLVDAAEGDDEAAIANLERALEAAPGERDPEITREYAATQAHLAEQLFGRGNLFRAMRLWEDAVKELAAIGEREDRAGLLDVLASVLAQQGDPEGAEERWREAGTLYAEAGDVAGEATVLARRAWLAESSGHDNRARELEDRACRALEEAGLWSDLAVLLNKLGAHRKDGDLLAQAFWLALQREDVPLEALVNLDAYFVQELGRESEAAPWIAGATLRRMETDADRDHPRFPELYRVTLDLFLSSVKAQGIPETEIREWTAENGLQDPAVVFPRALETLAAHVPGNQWRFSPGDFPGNGNRNPAV